MRFPGTLTRRGKFWILGIPAFDAKTQGRTKREALSMTEDLLETMVDAEGFKATAYATGPDSFEIEGNKTGVMIRLLLRRQRERHGLKVADVDERLGRKNAYAPYEYGCFKPTVEKLEQLLQAIAPELKLVLQIKLAPMVRR
ncbi:MAG TPA: hypothetical protein VFV19_17320 [Candidatus Polarisedimenticolaceae bacterium]|nr:hypothetical protein [Candidatus Polarisedimenticolaceae bacterium]